MNYYHTVWIIWCHKHSQANLLSKYDVAMLTISRQCYSLHFVALHFNCVYFILDDLMTHNDHVWVISMSLQCLSQWPPRGSSQIRWRWSNNNILCVTSQRKQFKQLTKVTRLWPQFGEFQTTASKMSDVVTAAA